MNRMFILLSGVFLWVGIALTGNSIASEYKEISVSNGGTLSGKVTLKGEVPDSRAFPLVLYPFANYCKKISDGRGNVVVQEYIVGPDQGLQDTVLAVQEVKAGKPFPEIRDAFVAVDCMFHPADVPDSEQFEVSRGGTLLHVHPSVGVIRNDQKISVLNKDPIIHNGQVFQSERGDIVLNFPLPVSTKPNGGIIHLEPGKKIAQMICGMHEFMQTYGYVVDNPYYARTKRDGLFSIDRLPPGTYKVIAWHPHFKPIKKEITVPANGNVLLNFEFDSTNIRHPNYEIRDKFRIGPEAHQHGDIKECEPPYCEK